MKMSLRDRFEALIRMPAYCDDYKKRGLLIERVKKHNKKTINKDLEDLKAYEAEIRKKWKVTCPFPMPISVGTYGARKRMFPTKIFEDELAVEVIDPNAASKQILIGQALYKGYDPVMLNYNYESFRDKNGKRKVTYRGGKHLCMIIDLTKTGTELKREFKGHIDYYQKILPKEKSIQMPTREIDVWRVYDMHKKGLKPKDITKELQASKPHVVNTYQATYNAVVRAISKTEKIKKEITNQLPPHS